MSKAKSVNCPPCKGTGKEWGKGILKCRLCHGEGVLEDTFSFLPVCHYCEGTGRKDHVLFQFCDECGGCGHRMRKPATIAPVVPEGFDPLVYKRDFLISQLEVRDVTSSPKDGVRVVKIEAGKPVTAQEEVSKLLEPLGGDICVCDPFYGTGTLLRLRALSKARSVRFLTNKPDTGEISLIPRAIAEFKTEHPQFAFRKHVGKDLHDRFVVTADELILLGHGLKDVGRKESFVVRLDRKFAGDVIDEIQESFNAKWKRADPL